MNNSNPGQAAAAPRRWLTIREATDISSLKRSTLYNLMNARQLEYATVGRTRRIPLDGLLNLMEANTVRAVEMTAAPA
jgi:excisionase family DNA binding protein